MYQTGQVTFQREPMVLSREPPLQREPMVMNTGYIPGPPPVSYVGQTAAAVPAAAVAACPPAVAEKSRGSFSVASLGGGGSVMEPAGGFVRRGSAGYNPVEQQSYSYVGQGAGVYQKDVVMGGYNWNSRRCCLILLCLLLLLPAFLYLMKHMFFPSPMVVEEEEAPQQVVVVTTQAPAPAPKPEYDCTTTDLWSLHKKDFCCKHYNKGCPTHAPKTTPPVTAAPTAPPTTPPPPPPVHIAVPVPVPTPPPLMVAPPAPPVVPVTTSLPFDCSADWTTCYHCLQARWSVAKRSWCCAHARRGCTTTSHAVVPAVVPAATSSLPYDCNADYTTCYHCLMARWSVTKRTWCCAHTKRGCTTAAPPATTSLPFNCADGFANWQAGWSVAKKSWCCQHQHKGCPPATTSLPYDCNADFLEWQSSWSVTKKTWCCQHVHKGCPPPAPTTSKCLPMDCNVAFNNWRAAWTKEKQQFCCQHEGKACA